MGSDTDQPDDDAQPRLSRRRLIVAGATVAGAAWAAPVVDSLTSPAGASTGSGAPKGCTTKCCVGQGFEWQSEWVHQSSYVWFSARITSVTNAPGYPFLLTCTNQSIAFPSVPSVGCPSFEVQVPDCSVTLLEPGSPSANCVWGDGTWSVEAPSDGGHIFAGGCFVPVSSFCDYTAHNGCPGNQQPSWCGDFVIPSDGTCITWECQASVYTSDASWCESDWNRLAVQPCDSYGQQQWPSGQTYQWNQLGQIDQLGGWGQQGQWGYTPEGQDGGSQGERSCTPTSITSWCTGGARGGDQSNSWCGSPSSSGQACCSTQQHWW